MGCKYEGTGIWSGRCKGTKEVDPCPGYDKCERYKPDYKTNADRIRAMSDEELAEWLFEFDCEAVAIGLLQMEHGLMTKEERLEWLQQSAE